nr:glycosyltransferase [Candidatus Shapirobacteria bacterium]
MKTSVLMINSSVKDGGTAKVVEQLRAELKKKSIESSLWVKKKLVEDSGVFELGGRQLMLKQLSKVLGRDDIELYLNDLFHQALATDVSYFNNEELWGSHYYRNCSVVHCHNLHGMFFNLDNLINISKLKKVVWTLHDMWPITGHCAHSFECDRWIGGCHNCPHLDTYQSLAWDNSRNLWNTKKLIYKKTKMTVVVPSVWLLNKVKHSILSDQKIVLIPNGVDEAKFIPGDKRKFKAELGIDGGRKVVLFLAQGGTDNVWKGGEYFK